MPVEVSPDDALRLFFALPLVEGLRAAAGEVQGRIARAGAKIKWVEPENLHFTLKFLGEVPASTVARLTDVAGLVAARHAPVVLHIAGAGAFPRPNDARVAWLGCREGAEALTALATDLDDALAAARLAPRERRPFKAHLTIGRNKDRDRGQDLAQALQAETATEIGRMAVESFVLMRSQLRREGPIYTEVARFELEAV